MGVDAEMFVRTKATVTPADFVEHGCFPFLDMVPEVTCDFCGFAMFGGGGGGRVRSYHCPGCDVMKQTQDGGQTWITREAHRGCRRD